MLHWYDYRPGEWHAWHTTDGEPLPCPEVRVQVTHLGLRVALLDRYGQEIVALALNHQHFTVEEARRQAERLLTEFEMPTTDAEINTAIFVQRMRERSEPRRCQFVHAWAAGAKDDATCACGRITRQWAIAHGLAHAS